MYLPVYVLSGDAALRAGVLKALELLDYRPALAADVEPGEGWPEPGLIVVDGRVEQSRLDRVEALQGYLAGKLPPVVVVLAAGRLPVLEVPRLADDYVLDTDPPERLAARLHFVAVRARGGEGEEFVRAGELSVNLTGCQATLGGRELDLTLKEYQLLVFLMQHPGRLYSREQLLAEVWGYDYFGGTRTVDVHIRRLRMKIGSLAERTISTVRGMGYRFDPPE